MTVILSQQALGTCATPSGKGRSRCRELGPEEDRLEGLEVRSWLGLCPSLGVGVPPCKTGKCNGRRGLSPPCDSLTFLPAESWGEIRATEQSGSCVPGSVWREGPC